MALKSFNDFEHNLEEENLRGLQTDSAGARKQLLKSFDKSDDGSYVTKRHMVWDRGEHLVISTGDEHAVVLKIVGFE